MISDDQAKNLLKRKTAEIVSGKNRPAEVLPLEESVGRVLAADITAPIAVPSFDNAAMDGFALKAEDTHGASPQNPVHLPVVGEARAGDMPVPLEGRGHAIRIMTGAPVPEGADAMVMKEVVSESGNEIRIFSDVSSGQHIRRKGEDIQPGALAVPGGTRLTAGAIGFLASLGFLQVPVAKGPRVSILATGSELVSSKELKPGKIFDSNSLFLDAALKEMAVRPQNAVRVEDDRRLLEAELAKALPHSDVVILTGGVSVGDHDATRDALASLGVKPLFWKVAQKPGKPLFAGWKDDKLVFGLPGNPYAVLVCFYLYVRPALFAWMGSADGHLKRTQMKLWGHFEKSEKKDRRAHFLKGKSIQKEGEDFCEILPGQASHLLYATTRADLLIYFPLETNEVKTGEKVQVLWLP